MKELFNILESMLSETELIRVSNILNKKYRTSRFFRGWSVLDEVLFTPLNIDINDYESKYNFRDVFSSIIMKYSRNETVIKYHLSQLYIDNEDETMLFEYSASNSRVDFARVNGYSYAYEIKTELDSLDRIKQQTQDYMKIFEYITVVTHIKHITKLRKEISRNVGIVSYEFLDGTVIFNEIRSPKYNKGFQKKEIISNLTSEEMKLVIETFMPRKAPQYKEDRKRLIDRSFSKAELNVAFKSILKMTRQNKWEYIKNNIDTFPPIDIQSYYTNS